MYGTNFGLARLELKWLWLLQHSLLEMVQRVSKTEPILSGPEPGLSRGERRDVGAARKRKFGVPRFLAGNSLVSCDESGHTKFPLSFSILSEGELG